MSEPAIDWQAMGAAERERMGLLLAEVQRRRSMRLVETMFPDHGPTARALYPVHLEFFEGGIRCHERVFMAGNRVGKTMAAGTEVSYHLSGLYPDWWVGRRFKKPVRFLASGDTHDTTRDIIQIKMLGATTDNKEKYGTGLIRGELIVSVVARSHVKGAVEKITVRHHTNGVYDGDSELWLRSYEQGREIFQGFELDGFWADEECPEDVYEEAQVRLMTTNGLSMLTFTPLSGLTPLVQKLTKPKSDITDADDPDGMLRMAADDRLVVRCGWDDVPHLTPEQKARLYAKLAPHQREARTKGVPSLGSGAIYPVLEDEIKIAPFLLPPYWKRGYGMDVGWNRTAALHGAYDEESDTIYVYAEHYRGQAEPSIHTAAIKARGEWIPGAVDPAARGRSQISGEQLLALYTDLGLNLIPALNGVDPGIYEVWERMSTGRLKIFSSCLNTLSEYRIYRRDEKGKIVKENDHAMDALRYLVMFLSVQRGGRVKPAEKKKATAGKASWRAA